MIKISRECGIYDCVKIFGVAEIQLTWIRIAVITIARDWGENDYFSKIFYLSRLGTFEIRRPRKNDDIPF